MNKVETEKMKTLELLSQAGLPQFELGADGYPLPGKVVKYYRERMRYRNTNDEKEKHWTQADLGQRLDLSEVQVCNMENHNQGLDSVERRRTLATILRIPPVLLGLGSLDLIVEIVTGHTSTNQTIAKRSKIGRDTIKQYQATFKVYETLFAEGLTYASINDIDKWAKRIGQNTKNVNEEDKNALLRVLWDFEVLCAKVYGSDLYDWNRAFEHIDNAIEIATTLDDRDLQAASLYTSGVYHLRQGRLGLAKVDIDGASMYARGALPQTRGIILSLGAFYHVENTGVSGITVTQKFLEQAEEHAGAKSEIRTLKFGKGSFFIHKAEALVKLGRPAKALELIDDAERYIHPSKKRLLVFMDILRARCYIEQKKPEYEYGIKLLEGAIADSRELRVARNIDHIEKLYRKLLDSSYGKAPDVIDLGLMLQELQVK